MRTLVNIDVSELQRAIEFYTTALGLKLSRIIDGDVAELTGASSMIYLLANPAGDNNLAGNPRDYRRHWTPVHIDFVVDDIGPATQRARFAKASVWFGAAPKALRLPTRLGMGSV